MRYFLSSGEPSGELVATLLAGEIAQRDASARFEGIGDRRMRDAGFDLYRSNRGWAVIGVFAALPRIPKMLAIAFATARYVAKTRPDAVVLVDFGAFHVRLARYMRVFGYRGPILDLFPPGAWLDRERGARAVARSMIAVPAFLHQRDFYRRLGLPARYFGHPLASQYAMRERRAAPAPDGGTVAILAGSRASELRHHLPAIAHALSQLRTMRPHVRAIFAAADSAARGTIEEAVNRFAIANASVVNGIGPALAQCDAAWVASGTAVLETALLGVPCIAFYIVDARTAKYVRRIYRRAYYTLPNLVLNEPVVPEFMQEDATPEALARAMDGLLRDPACQYANLQRLKAAVGPADALAKIAEFIVQCAREHAT